MRLIAFALGLTVLVAGEARAAPRLVAHRASAREIECEQSFENLLRFRAGWRKRVIAEKIPARCQDEIRSSISLIPPVSRTCEHMRFENTSPELKRDLLAILNSGKSHKIPKPKMHRVYRQIVKKTINNLKYFCRKLAAGVATRPQEEWEPGMTEPAPSAPPSRRR